jgi:hypothetical protein
MKQFAALSHGSAYVRFATMWPPLKLLFAFAAMFCSFVASAQTISLVVKQQLSLPIL